MGQIYLTEDEGKGRPNSKNKIKSKVSHLHMQYGGVCPRILNRGTSWGQLTAVSAG